MAGNGTVYRLDSDPRERRGRGNIPAPEELRARVQNAVPVSNAEPKFDDETRRALEALGYLDPGESDGKTP